ncbi:predicted protein [Pyrenophora tritici-repentis Pt-1C-BFP]|uniref:Uncharacterized protein n=1 Tax=Pyrenophora tritici-repentis (strain Pt-1C-BFP) TaxID=426418 RepID=B2WEU9_PYRTR|nr:uncharacterized protein PTRG_08672 [Pyrenophora tritici-repentis Pt-1C-BFP]EDU51591.1 predicted protein [Pyrenophora tritici-repentis Pt-1C-BFP]
MGLFEAGGGGGFCQRLTEQTRSKIAKTRWRNRGLVLQAVPKNSPHQGGTSCVSSCIRKPGV